MAMVCGKCKAYDPEGAVTTCPTCELPMQFTLLPPQGSGQAAPLPIEPDRSPTRRAPAAPQGSQLGELFCFLFRARWILRILLLTVGAGGGYYGVQSYEGMTGKQRTANDPFDLQSKFDDIQDKISHPQPVTNFQSTPMKAVNFTNPNQPKLTFPQPAPVTKRPPGR